MKKIPKGRAWTESEIDILRALWKNPAWSYKEIATHLDRTDWSIKNKAYRLGLGKMIFSTENLDLGTLQSLECYGEEFGPKCVDRCPGWDPCLNAYIEKEKKRLIKLEKKVVKARVTGKVASQALIEALREAVRA